MIAKLNEQQAQDVILRACADCEQAPTMRFGQAVWNHMPQDLIALYTNTEADFFYEEDEGTAALKFFKHFVQREVMEGIVQSAVDEGNHNVS